MKIFIGVLLTCLPIDVCSQCDPNIINEVANSPFSTGGTDPSLLDFNLTGRLLAVGNSSSNVTLFNVSPNGQLTQVTGSPFPVTDANDGLKFSPDGLFLALSNDSGSGSPNTIAMYSVDSAGVITEIGGSPFPAAVIDPQGLDFSPDGSLLAVAENGGTDVATHMVASDGTLALVGSFSTGGTGVARVAFNPGGTLLASVNGVTQDISMFTVDSSGVLTLVPTTPVAFAFPTNLMFSPDGNFLFVTGSSGVAVFSVASDGSLSEIVGSPFVTGSGPNSVSLTPDGKLLATSNTSSINIFSVSSDGSLANVAGSPFPVAGTLVSGSFSPGGTLYAATNFASDAVNMFCVNQGLAGLALNIFEKYLPLCDVQ